MNITPHVDHRFGGLTTSVPAFCHAIADTGRYTAPLAAFCFPDESEPEQRPQQFERFPFGRLPWAVPRSALRKRLESTVRNASLVHIHGIWQEHCSIASGISQKFNRPYVVSAHGMLEPWALRNKRWKKSIYWNMIERQSLSGARCLRALTNAEAGHYRSVGLKLPVAVIPNGVSIPDGIGTGPFWLRFPELQGKRILLFMSRIHHKKGLDLLLKVWARLLSEYRDTHLVLAGPDSEGTQRGLEQLISTLGISQSVTFAGMLRGQEKWAALAAATAFLLPSYSEGFSIAVLEAMGAGTPVVISEQCYFPEVRRQNCGWVIDPEAASLERVMRECLEITRENRDAMGERGRLLVRERFSWPAIGMQMADLADWILGGAVPDTLELITK